MRQILCLLPLLLFLSPCQGRFQVIREWHYINFTWPNEQSYQTALATGNYIPEHNLIAGIKYHEDYYYVSLPRMKSGVPATLARIPAGVMTRNTSPDFEPYPDWEMNQIGDCNALQNVQNLEIDSKGQMWIIDGGRIETLTAEPIVKCQPKLVVYDLKSGSLTLNYPFPENVASKNGSYLYDLVVDETDGGFVYITDNSGGDPGIIVYSAKENRSWKIFHKPSMVADPAAAQFRAGNVMINVQINIAGISLGPKLGANNDREIFYSPLSSLHIYSINSTFIKNPNNHGEYQGEVKDYGMKDSQSMGMVADNEGNLYFGLLNVGGIAKWNLVTGQKRLLVKDEKHLQWPNSFTFDDVGNLTVLANSLNRFIYNRMNISNINFRLVIGRVGGKSYIHDTDYRSPHSDESNDKQESDGIDDVVVPPQLDTTSDQDSAPPSSSESDPTIHYETKNNKNQDFYPLENTSNRPFASSSSTTDLVNDLTLTMDEQMQGDQPMIHHHDLGEKTMQHQDMDHDDTPDFGSVASTHKFISSAFLFLILSLMKIL